MPPNELRVGWFTRDGWLWARAPDGTETCFAPAPDGEPYIPTKPEWEELLARVKRLAERGAR